MPVGQQGWKHSGKRVNWDDVSVEGRSPPPEGPYDAKVVSMEPGESKKGDPMLSVKLEMVGSEKQELRDEGVGRFVYDNFVFNQEGAFKAKQYCQALGIDPPETVDYEEISEFCTDQVGKVVPVQIAHRTFDGKPRANVQYYGAEPPTDETNGKSQRHGSSRPSARQSSGRKR